MILLITTSKNIDEISPSTKHTIVNSIVTSIVNTICNNVVANIHMDKW